MKSDVLNTFKEFIDARSKVHLDQFQPAIAQFISETEEKYFFEINIFLSTYKNNPILEGILKPFHTQIKNYLIWLRWLNWNIANLGPILFKSWEPTIERLALSTLAYASGRFIDDGFDNHQNFKGHQNTLVGFIHQQFHDKPSHEACVQSVFVGFHLFHYILRRMEELKHFEAAAELSRLFNFASVGLLAECQTEKCIEQSLYFQIVRRKSVAYNMMLYKPFLQESEPKIRNNLLILFGEMDELAQILNDLGDIEEDSLKGRMNIFTHLENSTSVINYELSSRAQKLMDLLILLPIEIQNAFSSILVNLKLENVVKKWEHAPRVVHPVKYINENKNNSDSIELASLSAIRKALRYLTRSQEIDGSFSTYWSENTNMIPSNYLSSPFITGMILLALSEFNNVDAQTICSKGLSYLKQQRNENGFFSFLDQGLDYDLDDTCLLNFLVQQQDNDYNYYIQLAKQIHSLPHLNGLYYTWIRPNTENVNDIDPCVNLNILRFLTDNGIDCSATLNALKNIFKEGKAFGSTLYYEPAWAFLYLFSTLPKRVKKVILPGDNLSQLLKLPGTTNPVDQAMQLYCLSSTEKNSTKNQNLLSQILESQAPSGEWPSCAVFRAFNYWGSSELTTAISIQAILQCVKLTDHSAFSGTGR